MLDGPLNAAFVQLERDLHLLHRLIANAKLFANDLKWQHEGAVSSAELIGGSTPSNPVETLAPGAVVHTKMSSRASRIYRHCHSNCTPAKLGLETIAARSKRKISSDFSNLRLPYRLRKETGTIVQ